MNQYWSWILTAVGITGFILAGRKIWWCWYINIACQALWMTYAIVTEQWGFIVASLVYTVVFTQNAIKWTKEHRSKQQRIDNLIHTPIGRVTAASTDELGMYARGYIDADVANSLGWSRDIRYEPVSVRPNETVKAALDLIEKRIKDGTATTEEVLQFLRLGGMGSRE